MTRRLAAELVGTFFLVLIGPGAAMVNARTGGGLGVTGVALSFALMLVIVAVATDTRPGVAPIVIGLTVGCCALTGGPLTGASMNPARSLGPAVVGGLWHAHWLYWVAPIAGMVVAVHSHDWLRGARHAG
jgi:aquaporin NIP